MLDLAISPTNTLEAIPCTLPEQQLSPFKFYSNHAVQDGMTYGNELYRLAKQFSLADRSEVYLFGCELISQGIPTIISVSKQHYSVWVSLRNHSAVASAA